MEPNVIQVNEWDEEVGYMPKMEAHLKGVLHRAVSVFLFSSDGKWLLQQRASHKYHSGGLWSNTCCSHPLPQEESKAAAERRLMEEMGIDLKLEKLFNFTYRANLDNGLIEHELDHIYIGFTNEKPKINPEEVQDWKYASFDDIQKEIISDEERYTAWFRMMFREVYKKIKKS